MPELFRAGSDFWIGAAFIAAAIVAVLITRPRRDGTSQPGTLTARQLWTLFGVVVVAEIALRLLSTWLHAAYGIPQWQCLLAAATLIVGVAVAARLIGRRAWGRDGS